MTRERVGVEYVGAVDWREDRIGAAHRGENPTVLAELDGGFAVIGDAQFLPGYCVLLGKDPSVTALAEMPRADRVQFLADADLLATAVERACRAIDPKFRRVNLDVLGNADAFVHAHIWPRYEWEPPSLVTRPVWLYEPDRWRDPQTALSAEHAELRARITTELGVLTNEDTVHISG
jgi:diadenosine tetraphosphate (Ap4A) HIT family hydrolase